MKINEIDVPRPWGAGSGWPGLGHGLGWKSLVRRCGSSQFHTFQIEVKYGYHPLSFLKVSFCRDQMAAKKRYPYLTSPSEVSNQLLSHLRTSYFHTCELRISSPAHSLVQASPTPAQPSQPGPAPAPPCPTRAHIDRQSISNQHQQVADEQQQGPKKG